jgi:hypothetical protein
VAAMTAWFGQLKTRHNPPVEALDMNVSVFGPVKKGDIIEITIPVLKEMILTPGMVIRVKVVIT